MSVATVRLLTERSSSRTYLGDGRPTGTCPSALRKAEVSAKLYRVAPVLRHGTVARR